MKALRKRDFTPLILTALMAALWGVLHILLETSPVGPAFYNTYTRQALAWRSGSLHLPEDVPYLELAIFQGAYYVSFPPVPSLLLLPLTFLFGMDTPDNLLVKLYAWGGCILMYQALKKAGYGKASGGAAAFLFTFASSLLPMTLDGAVWYHAQVLAFFLTTASVCLLTFDRPTLSLLCYALSVGCRPFNALYGLPLFFTYWIINRRSQVPLKATAKELLPGVGLGLLVAAELGLYNFVRFGSPMEFGHNYLPEFSFQGGVQFSLDHVTNNLETFLLGLPFDVYQGEVAFKSFGFSMLIACPTLTLMLFWLLRDIFKRQLRWEQWVMIITCLLHAFLLLLHRTFGGYQLGARYAVDLIPYSFFYLLLSPKKKRLNAIEILGLLFVLALMIWGVTQVHI